VAGYCEHRNDRSSSIKPRDLIVITNRPLQPGISHLVQVGHKRKLLTNFVTTVFQYAKITKTTTERNFLAASGNIYVTAD
jgi:hypothetical protein